MFLLEILEKNVKCILILAIYWKKTGLLHTKISNHNILYSSYKPRKLSYVKTRFFLFMTYEYLWNSTIFLSYSWAVLCYCCFSTHTQATSSHKSFTP